MATFTLFILTVVRTKAHFIDKARQSSLPQVYGRCSRRVPTWILLGEAHALRHVCFTTPIPTPGYNYFAQRIFTFINIFVTIICLHRLFCISDYSLRIDYQRRCWWLTSVSPIYIHTYMHACIYIYIYIHIHIIHTYIHSDGVFFFARVEDPQRPSQQTFLQHLPYSCLLASLLPLGCSVCPPPQTVSAVSWVHARY